MSACQHDYATVVNAAAQGRCVRCLLDRIAELEDEVAMLRAEHARRDAADDEKDLEAIATASRAAAYVGYIG